MSKNVLYLSYDGMTDPLGQSQVIPYLAGLSRCGYRFTLVSFEKPGLYLQHKEHIEALLAQSEIRWVPLVYHKKPPVFSTLYDLWLLRRIVKELHKLHHFRIVHCRSYLTALIGLHMNRQNGIKFIFDMRGFWADERVDGNIWNIDNLLYKYIYRYFKQKEKELLSEADYTVSLTENAKEEIHSWKGIANNPIPIKVIPCCADLELFQRNEVEKFELDTVREKLGIVPNMFILLYLGSTGTWYLLDEMLNFFKHLLEKEPNARFLFVTKDHPASIFRKAEKYRIPVKNLIITSVERKELPIYISLAQLSIFFIKPAYSKKASSPTKMGEIMGMGVPIICNDGVGDTTRIIKETEAGVIIEHFTGVHYRQIVSNLEWLIKKDKKQIRAGALRYYSLNAGIEKYADIYRNVLR